MFNYNEGEQKIIKMLEDGYTPEEIMRAEPQYKKCRYQINELLCSIRSEDFSQYLVRYKDKHTEWHICSPYTSKKLYTKLCKEHGKKSIYKCSLSDDNALEKYIDKGAPPILFIDGYTGNLEYEKFLNLLDIFITPRPEFMLPPYWQFWTTTIVTSPLPPEEIYMCPETYYRGDYEEKRNNIAAPLLRRLNTVTYYYRGMSFTMLAEDYKCFNDLKYRAKHCKDVKL